jgi:hypothetical protein
MAQYKTKQGISKSLNMCRRSGVANRHEYRGRDSARANNIGAGRRGAINKRVCVALLGATCGPLWPVGWHRDRHHPPLAALV